MLVFWGLVLEPSKRYTQKVQQSFHISQAALELSESDTEPIQLVLEYDGANYVLGTLSKKASLYQIPLDLNFNAGDQISFRTIGRGRVHLTGYHLTEEDMSDMRLAEASALTEEKLRTALAQALLARAKRKRARANKIRVGKIKKRKLSSKNVVYEDDSDDDDDDASEEDTSNGMASDDEDEESDEEEVADSDEDEDDDSDEDETHAKGKKKTPKKKSASKVNGQSPKKKKQSDMKGASKSSKKASPAPKGAKEKTPKSEKKSPKGEKKDQNKQDFTPQKRVVEGGVIVEEIKVGEGQVAKPGKMVQVYYVGRLQSNNKQFDSTTHGPGFKFKLGKGEVIRGWDIGVNGMRVGGKRKIIIPAQLGYGARGAPPAIPPNSVLVFDVELKGIN